MVPWANQYRGQLHHVAYWLAKYIIDATTTTSRSTKDRDRATFFFQQWAGMALRKSWMVKGGGAERS